MSDFRPADHAMGLELQIEELNEQRARAVVQGRTDDAQQIDNEIARLQAELATTADLVAQQPDPGPEPQLQDAEQLGVPEV